MKLLIANRGEIAARIARTCRELGVATVAVFSDPDEGALHVEACDEAVRIGGATPAESYLRIEALLDAARRSGADAIHPGYGFLSENAAFASAVRDAGLTWVGPSPQAIASMGDKLEAKRRMQAAGVPVLPGREVRAGGRADPEGIGFPLLVKAAAGGGGRGMRLVPDGSTLEESVRAAQREAESAFGDGRVFLEHYVSRPHHVEVQILGDLHGNVVHLFERECSIQRRHQKIIEESPSPRLSPSLRERLCAAAVTAGKAIGYASAGTVEFVAEEHGGELSAFWFLEVNTRLQVEHPVTESVVRVRGAPVDLVALQLAVARGDPLPFTQSEIGQVGHALEARLYAEDPAAGYLPSAGTLFAFAPPAEPAVRWDCGTSAGRAVPPYYDPMIAKVISHRENRRDAALSLARALERTHLAGVTTNRDLLVAVLRSEPFLRGDTTTHFLDEHFRDPASRRRTPGPAEVRTAAIAAAVAEVTAFAHPGAPSLPPLAGNVPLPRAPFRHAGGEVALTARRDGTLDAGGAMVRVLAAGPGQLTLEIDGHRQAIAVARRGAELAVLLPGGQVDLQELPRFPDAAAEETAGACVAPMPGIVVEVAVAPGAHVKAGDLLVVLEAMKMEHRLTAAVDGTVEAVRVAVREQVGHDDVLVVITPDAA
jgi:propionyl-CoA carboxylase alpha chain